MLKFKGDSNMKEEDLRLFKQNLPQFPGVQGREKYFNSAVLIPLVLINEQYHFLFQKRASNIRQGGEICFPGGKYDPKIDLDYSKTAIRETVEELGLTEEKIKIEGRLDTLVAPMGAIIDAFVGRIEIKRLNELSINKKEVEDVFCLPVSFFENETPEEYKVRVMVESSYIDNGEERILLPAKELGLPERYHKPWGGTFHSIYLYNTEKGTIWGITAELIREVIRYCPKK